MVSLWNNSNSQLIVEYLRGKDLPQYFCPYRAAVQAQHINLRNNISSVEQSDVFEGCDSHTVADN